MLKILERRPQISESDQKLRKIKAGSKAAERLVKRLEGTAPLGYGATKIVYPYGDRLAVAFFPEFQSNHRGYREYLKKAYFSIKLMHLLKPQNVPDAHLVGSDPPIMFLDRVKRAKKQPSKAKARAPRQALMAEFRDLRADVDGNHNNYLIDEEGNLQYVDSFSFHLSSQYAIHDAISHLMPEDQAKAIRYAQRAGAFPVEQDILDFLRAQTRETEDIE